MAGRLTADAGGARETLGNLWALAGLPGSVVERLALTGEGPLLPTSFHVGVAAQSTIGAAALAASFVSSTRGGPASAVHLDMHDAERECTGYFELNGAVPSAWAPLSGLYPCRDGFVRIHANFDHHRDGALALLGLGGDASRYDKDDVVRALGDWNAEDFETAAAERGLVVSAARSFDEWDAGPHARAAATLPLFSIERIGDAPPMDLPAGEAGAPLDGIRVLDLTRILAGPTCGRVLAAYGADVLLINGPHLPNIDAIADTSRGKRSAQLDLREAAERAQLESLARGAHVFVEGYRSGGIAELGFSPQALATMRPGIVTLSLSAYGPIGPWSARRGFDSLVQTATGFNHAEGRAAGKDRPRALPVQMLDYGAGFLMAFGAQAALVRQQHEGGSWHVRVSLLQVANWLRSLGRVDDNFSGERPELKTRCENYPSNFGELRAVPHAARIEDLVPSNGSSWRPGTHDPVWA